MHCGNTHYSYWLHGNIFRVFCAVDRVILGPWNCLEVRLVKSSLTCNQRLYCWATVVDTFRILGRDPWIFNTQKPCRNPWIFTIQNTLQYSIGVQIFSFAWAIKFRFAMEIHILLKHGANIFCLGLYCPSLFCNCLFLI